MMRKYILLSICLLLGLSSVYAETISLSYSEGKNAANSPVGPGTGDNAWIDMAIKIPGSTIRAMEGASITGINGSCASIASIERLHIWLRTELDGENLTEFEMIPNQLKNLKKGKNELKFKTPWVIPAGYEGDLYIGFGYKYKDYNARGLAVLETPTPDGFYLYRADSQWYDFSHLGTACIEAIVEGENLPKINPQLSRVDFPPYFIETRTTYNPALYIHNFGTETVTAYDVTATFNGENVVTQRIETSHEPGMMKILNLAIIPPASEIEQSSIEININPVSDVADADTENNTIAGTFITAPFEYTRRVLSEEFTTELCGNCPEVTGWINEELKKEEFKDVIMVCHHSGYLTDFLTTPWAEEYVKLFGGGSFAPGVAADRAIYIKDDIVFFPETTESLTDWWHTRLNEPALVSVDIKVEQSATADDEIIVTVSGEKCIEKIAKNPCVTVWLTEDNIAAEAQANGGKDYKHHHVDRAVQSENYWGEPITFENDKYTYTCTFKIEEGWVKENMHVVALVGENGTKYTDRLVCNANSVKLTDGLNSVNTITNDREVIGTQYYTITGQRVSKPNNGVYICQKSFSDGTTETTKIIVRQK